MTQFNKEDFSYHGGYLNYTGDYEGRPVWQATTANGSTVHPSLVGKGKDLFIARFKHGGPFTKAKFLAQLIKNFTVEEYVAERAKDGLDSSPLQILKNNNEDWYYKVMFAFKAKQEARRVYTSSHHCAYDYA
jgi:hypothetical protein|tara:strand:- start:9776 stop:10171 length:396 start_codon:yes stop_codon:yes gene_type:complete